MGAIYQLTFLLALALLAIVITVFVFAVSLLGRAMEAARESEKEKTTERRANNAREMATIKKEIEEAEANEQIPRGLRRKLDKLERRDSKFGKELSQIRKAPKLLTVRGGIVPCGVLLLAALVLTGLAWYLSAVENLIWMMHVFIWILGLVAIGYTVSRIYQCLRVIESVAVPSEEAALKRTIEAFKIAQKELEEEKKPKLALEFEDEQLPFHLKADSSTTIRFYLTIVQGVEATNPKAIFYAPPGFDFPGHATYKQTNASSTPNYITTEIGVGDVHKGISMPGNFTLKAPTESNSFTIFYRITSTDFSSDSLEFQVIVE